MGAQNMWVMDNEHNSPSDYEIILCDLAGTEEDDESMGNGPEMTG